MAQRPKPPRPDPGSLGDDFPSTNALWPDPERGPWHLRLYWGEIDGRVECVGVEMKSAPTAEDEGRSTAPGWQPDPRPLRSTDLRRLPLATIVEETRQSQAGFLNWWAELDEQRREQLRRKTQALADGAPRSGKGGRPPEYGPEHYAEVADAYSAAHQSRRDPRQAVAEHLHLSPSAAAKHVAKARKLGLLGPTMKGRAGGVPEPLERPKSKLGEEGVGP
jgi:hypothetical protein